jgi:hypothetical protein
MAQQERNIEIGWLSKTGTLREDGSARKEYEEERMALW